MNATPRRVTLLSDFGTVDGYAAAMAGVIAAAAPSALIEHASHDVPPGDIHTAALTLARYAFLYPPETVHLVVVDPGVGTDRRALAARVRGRLFVAPDNGVLSRVLRDGGDVVEIPYPPSARTGPAGSADRPEAGVSTTFHGRDIFAPAAACLVRGERLDTLGPAVPDPVLLTLPEPRREDGAVWGEVIQVDRFGNLISCIPGAWIEGAGGADVEVDGRSVGPIRGTYGEVEPGAPLALVGSLGLVEVSVRDGSAADRLGVGRGARILVRLPGSG